MMTVMIRRRERENQLRRIQGLVATGEPSATGVGDPHVEPIVGQYHRQVLLRRVQHPRHPILLIVNHPHQKIKKLMHIIPILILILSLNVTVISSLST